MTPLVEAVRVRLRERQRPLRFVVAGALNTVFGLAIFPLLTLSNDWLRQHYMVALVIAQVVSVVFAFMTYRVALKGSGGVVRQLSFFSSFYLLNYALNWVALPLLVETARLRPEIAQTGFALVLMAAAYFWHSRLTFRSHS